MQRSSLTIPAFTWIVFLAAQGAACAIEPIQIAVLVDGMASKGSGFDGSELHRLGTEGLAAVLDHLLPDTAPPAAPLPAGPPAEAVVKWIAELDHDDFLVRERATIELTQHGRGQRHLIEQAAASQQAESALRAQRILATWEARPQARLNAYLSGFWAYAEKIEDAERLKLLAERTLKAFEQGMPEGDRLHLLRLCLAAVAHGRQAASCDLLRPLVHEKDARIVTLAVETVGAYKSEARFFPALLIDALGSRQAAIVETALRFAAGCQDERQQPALKQALIGIFATGDEPLKFQACLPLMRDYHDAAAWRYVLEQTQSADPNRARTALNWIGDSPIRGQPASEQLVRQLVPLLHARSAELRRVTAQALAGYAHAQIVAGLLPLLSDVDESVARQAELSLRAQADQRLVRQMAHDFAARSAAAANRRVLSIMKPEQP